MDVSEIVAMPDLIANARRQQVQAKRRWLSAKRRYDKVQAEAYLRHLKHTHNEAIRQAALEQQVASAKEDLDEASAQYDEARIEADRLANVFELALSLRSRRHFKIVREAA